MSNSAGTPAGLSHIQAPFVIGVAGHRDLRPADIPHLERRVKETIGELKRLYPHTPFILLSSLAEGADRLVAHIVLAQRAATLVVPLPLPQSLYEDDFGTQGSKDEFRTLLGQAASRFEVGICTSLAAVEHPGPARDRQYAEAGKYIARRSLILLALWDGVDNNRTGGTAAVKKFQTEGVPRGGIGCVEAPEAFPTYQIVTPRVKNHHPSGGFPFSVRKHYPKNFSVEEAEDEPEKDNSPGRAAVYFDTLFRYLDEFNQDIEHANASVRAAAAVTRNKLHHHSSHFQWRESELRTLDRYCWSDALAICYQRKLIRADVLLHWLIFLAFSSFVVFAHLPEPQHPTPALIASLALLLAAALLKRYARTERFDSKHQDYRAIAEGLRVRLFWQIAGIADSVADAYLSNQRSELDWIRNGLRGWGIEYKPEDTVRSFPSATSAQTLRFVLMRWVNDQRRYFRRSGEKESIRHERKEHLILLFLYATVATALVVAAILLVQWIRPPHPWSWKEREWLDWAIIAIDLLLAGGALMHHHVARMGYSQHSKQYKRMWSIFRRASTTTSVHLKAGNLRQVRTCLRMLGREALTENGHWVLMHRERPLEMPHP